MAIISKQNFIDNYIIKNGEFINEDNLNRAAIQLKTEIDQLITDGLGGEDGALSLETFGINATAEEINTLAGAAIVPDSMVNLATYHEKLPFLANVTSDIQTQINDAVAGELSGTLNWQYLGLDPAYDETQLDWAASLYSAFNSAIGPDEISKLYGLTDNVQSKIDEFDGIISTLSSGGGITSLADLGITTSAIRINWLDTVYNSNIDSSELGQLNGCTTNIQQKFNSLDATISSLPTSTDYLPDSYSSASWSLGGAALYRLQGSTSSAHLLNVNNTATSGFGHALTAYTNASQGNGVIGSTKAQVEGGIFGVYAAGTNGTSFTTYGRIGTKNHAAYFAGAVVTSENGYAPFTGLHYALTASTSGMQIGDIVSNKTGVLLNVTDSIPVVETSASANDKRVVGVISEINPFESVEKMALCFKNLNALDENGSPLLNADGENFVSEHNGIENVHINALGEGGINVCEENGDIENGDYITSSNTPGKGMKQTSEFLANYTVAKALEDVVWGNETIGENGCFEVNGVKCKMIACTYHCG